MSTLLHLSDTHFGTERPEVVEALVALAGQIKPELVVLAGDITQRARPAQFAAAKALVERLAAPVLAIPGNHDIGLFDLWARLVCPYARYSRAFGAELEPVHASPELLVIGVNTTRAWRHKHGEVSAAQVERVAGLLAAATAQQSRVVVVHQPAVVTAKADQADRLRGSDAALPIWAAAGADLVLGGHIHLPYVLALPGLPRSMWVVQAGTATSARTRAGVPNSVNIVRWEPAGSAQRCCIEQWDFSRQEQRFALA
ncbi:metallophosphoesterase, partial [Chitinimonas sp.]|uniref:metallophosphoesterase family protein n=1 Tax=Chitinimonas sp. TaxID=1934313 RepID=UPI0035B3E723